MKFLTPSALSLSLCLLSFGTTGCQNYSEQLSRGQGYYERNQYETALAVFRNLEQDQSSLDSAETIRYCYLRGMTDFRLGYLNDARYWLGMAQAASKNVSGALLPDEEKRLTETLDELNQEVYGLEKEGEKKPAEEAQKLGDSCKWTSDCDSGFSCEEGACVQTQ